MPKLIKNGHVITTTVASEAVQLRAQGYVDVPQEPTRFDNGGELSAGVTAVTNDTGAAEQVKPARKPSK